MEEFKKKAVIQPVKFIDTEKKIEPSTMEQKDKPELKFNCKYGNITIKLSEIPILKDIL